MRRQTGTGAWNLPNRREATGVNDKGLPMILIDSPMLCGERGVMHSTPLEFQFPG